MTEALAPDIYIYRELTVVKMLILNNNLGDILVIEPLLK
jgi:hypothetical protein